MVFYNAFDGLSEIGRHSVKYLSTKHQIQNNNNQDNKDYGHDRKQYLNGKIYLENIPAQYNPFKLGNMLCFG